jgi:hypothetical protein
MTSPTKHCLASMRRYVGSQITSVNNKRSSVPMPGELIGSSRPNKGPPTDPVPHESRRFSEVLMLNAPCPCN